MGQLVFQATLGGQVNLVGPNTASTFNLSVPAVTATLATTDANTFTAAQTFSAGTANGVAYLNGSKVLTTGSALTFDGSKLVVSSSAEQLKLLSSGDFSTTGTGYIRWYDSVGAKGYIGYAGTASQMDLQSGSGMNLNMNATGGTLTFQVSNSEQMRLTSTGLGIGTSSPAAKLESVQGTSGAGGWYMAGQFSSATATMVRLASTTANKYASIGNDSDGGFHLFVNGSSGAVGTEAVILNASGNLGLGVTPSANSIAKAFELQTGFNIFGYANLGYINANAYYNGGWLYKNTDVAGRYEVGGAHKWYTAPSGTAGNAISFTQAMTLDASGKLGIGTTSPQNYLHVQNGAGSANGTLRLGDATYYGTIEQDASVTGAMIYTIASASGGGHIWKRGSTENMRLDSSGNLLVGTTSSAKGSSGTIISQGSGFENIRLNGTSPQTFVTFNLSGTTVGSISASGSVTTYNVTSDYRLKDIDGPVTNSGAFIDKLNPVQGSWKADGSRFIGFLAHELQEASETVVGTGVKDGEEMQSIDYSNAELIANLVAEIQSLRKRLATLESK